MKSIITASLAIICLAVLFADFSVALALPKRAASNFFPGDKPPQPKSGQAEVPFLMLNPLNSRISSVSCCKSQDTIYPSQPQAVFGCGYAGYDLIAPELEFGTYACSYRPSHVSGDLQSFNNHCTIVFKGVTKDARDCANNVMDPSIPPFAK